MTWHYQLMKHTETSDYSWYGVHEFYKENQIPTMDNLPSYFVGGYTANPVEVFGDTPEEVVEQLKAMIKDIEKHGVKDYE